MCDKCLCRLVCSKHLATGGNMVSCVHFVHTNTPRDENGGVPALRVPMAADEIAIVLTREQWDVVKAWLEFGDNYHTGKACQWQNTCADLAMKSEQVRKHLASAATAAAVLSRIVAAFNGASEVP